MFSYALLSSDFGEVGIVWPETASGPSVSRVFLPRPGISVRALIQAGFPGARPSSVRPVARLADQIKSFLGGDAVHFDLDSLNLERCSDFQARVLLAERQIPRGWVSTYGGIARHLAVPAGARAVGQALARNPFPIIIPCHRAVRSDGRLGGFQGGPGMKRALLELEGVEFAANGRVLTERFYY